MPIGIGPSGPEPSAANPILSVTFTAKPQHIWTSGFAGLGSFCQIRFHFIQYLSNDSLMGQAVPCSARSQIRVFRRVL